MPNLKSVKEISRGTDWVKFLAVWESGVAFEQIRQWHDGWSQLNSVNLGCAVPETMPFNFSESAVIFKFKTKPYSMEVNAFYRYIDEFNKYLNGTTSAVNSDKAPDRSDTDAGTGYTTESDYDAYTKKLADKLIGGIFDGLLGTSVGGLDTDISFKNSADSCFVAGDPSKHTVTLKTNPAGEYALTGAVDSLTKPKFRTTNDVHVKSLISRIKNH